jgi:hypothetical protein
MSVNDVRVVLNLGTDAINTFKKIAKDSNTSMGEIVTHLLEQKALEVVDR